MSVAINKHIRSSIGHNHSLDPTEHLLKIIGRLSFVPLVELKKALANNMCSNWMSIALSGLASILCSFLGGCNFPSSWGETCIDISYREVEL